MIQEESEEEEKNCQKGYADLYIIRRLSSFLKCLAEEHHRGMCAGEKSLQYTRMLRTVLFRKRRSPVRLLKNFESRRFHCGMCKTLLRYLATTNFLCLCRPKNGCDDDSLFDFPALVLPQLLFLHDLLLSEIRLPAQTS